MLCKHPNCEKVLLEHQRFYCSRSCSVSMVNRGVIQELEIRICEHPDCQNQLNRNQDRFCSTSCRAKIVNKTRKRNQHPGFSEATRKKMSLAKKKSWENSEYREKQILAIEAGSKGNGVYNQKIQYFEGIKCYSKYEVRYLKLLKVVNIKLPIRARAVKTPYGYYTPDFDNGKEFVEVKCDYTLKMAIKSGQMKKIRWINLNFMKKVKVLNLDRYDLHGRRLSINTIATQKP